MANGVNKVMFLSPLSTIAAMNIFEIHNYINMGIIWLVSWCFYTVMWVAMHWILNKANTLDLPTTNLKLFLDLFKYDGYLEKCITFKRKNKVDQIYLLNHFHPNIDLLLEYQNMFLWNSYIKCQSIIELTKTGYKHVYALYNCLCNIDTFGLLVDRPVKILTPRNLFIVFSRCNFAFNKCTTCFRYYWDQCICYPHTVAVHSASVCSINGLCTKCMTRSHSFACIVCVMVLFIYTSLGQTHQLSQMFMWLRGYKTLMHCLVFVLHFSYTRWVRYCFFSDQFFYFYSPLTHGVGVWGVGVGGWGVGVVWVGGGGWGWYGGWGVEIEGLIV